MKCIDNKKIKNKSKTLKKNQQTKKAQSKSKTKVYTYVKRFGGNNMYTYKYRNNDKKSRTKNKNKNRRSKHCLQSQSRSRKQRKIVGGSNKEKPTPEEYTYELSQDYDETNGLNTKILHGTGSYNKNLFLRESHNCYTYFLDLKNKDALELCKKEYDKNNMCRRPQPGYASNHKTLEDGDYNCAEIMKRTLDDNPGIIPITNPNDKCPDGYYKGALVVAPGRDYHYYRQDDDLNGYWSHKPGYKPSTMRDSSNNLIKDPRAAARDYGGTLNYKDFCGYMCIPRDRNMKKMSYRGQLNQQNNTYNNPNATLNNNNNIKKFEEWWTEYEKKLKNTQGISYNKQAINNKKRVLASTNTNPFPPVSNTSTVTNTKN